MLMIQRFFPCQSSALSILVLQRLCPKMQRLSGHQGIRRVVQNPGWRKQSPVSLTRVQCPCACVPPRLDKCPLWALGSRTWALGIGTNACPRQQKFSAAQLRWQVQPSTCQVLCNKVGNSGWAVSRRAKPLTLNPLSGPLSSASSCKCTDLLVLH